MRRYAIVSRFMAFLVLALGTGGFGPLPGRCWGPPRPCSSCVTLKTSAGSSPPEPGRSPGLPRRIVREQPSARSASSAATRCRDWFVKHGLANRLTHLIATMTTHRGNTRGADVVRLGGDRDGTASSTAPTTISCP